MSLPEPIFLTNKNIQPMKSTFSILEWIEGIAFAFLLGYIFRKKSKRRGGKHSPSPRLRATSSSKPLQIEVNVENSITKHQK